MVTVRAVTPKKLTKEQRRLLEQLAATLPAQKFEPTPHDDEGEDKGLFGKVEGHLRMTAPEPARAARIALAGAGHRSRLAGRPAGRPRIAGRRGARRFRAAGHRRSRRAAAAAGWPVGPDVPADPRPAADAAALARVLRDARRRATGAARALASTLALVAAVARGRARRGLGRAIQRSLTAVTAGRFVVAPPWDVPDRDRRRGHASDRHRAVDGIRHRPPSHHPAVPALLSAHRRRRAGGCSTSAPARACWRWPRRCAAPRDVVGIDIDQDAIAAARRQRGAEPAAAGGALRGRRLSRGPTAARPTSCSRT